MTGGQLDIFGGWSEPRRRPKRARLTTAQATILKHIDDHGQIRTIEAGTIIHTERQCRHCKLGRCQWRATDGTDAMKRLMARGLVKRSSTGVWVRP